MKRVILLTINLMAISLFFSQIMPQTRKISSEKKLGVGEPISTSKSQRLSQSDSSGNEVDFLIQCLLDDSKKINERISAAKRLGEIGDLMAIKPLLDTFLRQINPSIQNACESALQKFGNAVYEEANTILEIYLKNAAEEQGTRSVPTNRSGPLSDPRTSSLISLLGKLDDPRVVTTLIAALKDAYCWDSSDAAKFLSKIKDKSMIEPLSQIVRTHDTNWYARKNAIFVLSSFKPDKFFELLIDYGLKDNAHDVKVETIRALGGLQDPRSIKSLIDELLYNEKVNFHYEIIEALGEIGHPNAIEVLEGFLEEKIVIRGWENRTNSSEAARALGNIRDLRSIAPLIKALRKGYVQSDAESSLMKLAMVDSLKNNIVEKLISELKREKSRVIAIRMLGNLGDLRAVNPLIVQLDKSDSRSWGREFIVEALGKLRDSRAIEPLSKELLQKDGSQASRRNAAIALGQIRDRRSIEPLIYVINNDTDNDIRLRALVSLFAIDRRQASNLQDAVLKSADKLWVGAIFEQGMNEFGDPLLAELNNHLESYKGSPLTEDRTINLFTYLDTICNEEIKFSKYVTSEKIIDQCSNLAILDSIFVQLKDFENHQHLKVSLIELNFRIIVQLQTIRMTNMGFNVIARNLDYIESSNKELIKQKTELLTSLIMNLNRVKNPAIRHRYWLAIDRMMKCIDLKKSIAEKYAISDAPVILNIKGDDLLDSLRAVLNNEHDLVVKQYASQIVDQIQNALQ